MGLVAQIVKNLPSMQETRVQSLDWKDPLEKKMATHSSILAWEIPWMEESGRLKSMGSQRVGHDWVTNTLTFLYHYSKDLGSGLIIRSKATLLSFLVERKTQFGGSCFDLNFNFKF